MNRYNRILQKEKPTHDRFTLNTSVSSSDLDGRIQLRQIADSLQMDKQKRPTMQLIVFAIFIYRSISYLVLYVG